MLAYEFYSWRTLRLWQGDLQQRPQAPFPIDTSTLFVAYAAQAELSCFLVLGWPMPTNILDLYAEFRAINNGKPLPAGNGLLGALAYYGLDAMQAEEKEAMRRLILSTGPWDSAEQAAILDYCESDVRALARLLPAIEPHLDWPRALLRGQYATALAHMESTGIPIDTVTLGSVTAQWGGIKQQLITDIDQDYGVFDGTHFKRVLFEAYLARRSIPWPRLPSGQLDLCDDTFKDMARAHPQLGPLHELRSALGKMRLTGLVVGDDGRNRPGLRPYIAKTGRNQPSSVQFIFGAATWQRGFIQPPPGWGLAYVDWGQQEFGIAAALSGDSLMMQAYNSGDPYLAFAKQAGAVPLDATAHSHEAERKQFKACVLAVQYGMGAGSLALRINQPVAHARELLDLHHRTYRVFWSWSEGIVNQAVLGGSLWTTYGWNLHTGDAPNDRSLRNFPMQANGAEMMRLACIRLTREGMRVCAPVHDALLIEAPLDALDTAVAHTQAGMCWASAQVLAGYELTSDAELVLSPQRYVDKRGIKMWNTVMDASGLAHAKVSKT